MGGLEGGPVSHEEYSRNFSGNAGRKRERPG